MARSAICSPIIRRIMAMFSFPSIVLLLPLLAACAVSAQREFRVPEIAPAAAVPIVAPVPNIELRLPNLGPKTVASLSPRPIPGLGLNGTISSDLECCVSRMHQHEKNHDATCIWSLQGTEGTITTIRKINQGMTETLELDSFRAFKRILS